MDKKYTIKLANGTLLKDLNLNGNNYISSIELKETVFTGNLSPVVISDGVTDEIHDFMELIRLAKYGDEYWFILRDVSESDVSISKLRADVDYMAMMTDVVL